MQKQVFKTAVVFILLAGVASPQSPKTFLDSVEARVEKISVPYNLAQWEFYTTGKSDSLEQYEKLWAAYVRDSVLFAAAVRLKDSDQEPARARCWELLHNLLLGEKVSSHPEILELVDSLSKIHFGFRATLRDSQKTDNEISKLLRTSADRELRREAYFAQAQRGGLLADGIQTLMRRRNELARGLGYPNYYELGMELAGLNRSFLVTVLSQLDTLTARPYRDLLGRIQKKLGYEKLEPWDVSFAHADLELKVDPYFPKDSLVPFLRRTMKGLGYRLDSLPITFDVESRPGKSQHAYSFGIDPPRDVRILMNAAVGVSSYRTVFHECGHSLASCYVSQPTWLLRNWLSGGFSEGMAEIFAGLIREKKWLTGYAHLPEKLADEYLSGAAEKELIYVRSVLVNLYFEFFACQNPEQDLNKLYWDLYEKYTFLPRHDEAKTWAGIVHFATHPIYLQNYLVADMIAAQTSYRLKQEIGELVDNPRFAAFMNEKYFAPGASKPWTDLVQGATGSELNPAYYMQELVPAKTSGEEKK
jgi:peptidyl-dipeptidase A